MRNDEQRKGVGRRGLLKGVGLATGGAAGAVAAASAVLGAAEEEAREAPEEQAKARYRESEEVRRFYALNRL